jgi:UDP-N-acetylglucosamine acyltransferase
VTGVSATIHPTAIVEEGASLGPGCIVHAHAMIGRHCVLGASVVVHPFAVIGGDPQDLKFDPATRSGVRIGARTVIREHVTIHRATKPDVDTEVGEDCYLMVGSHVAHDCVVGRGVVMANAVLLGGHISIGDRAFMGGGAVIHQFCRIGDMAMIGGGARLSLDVPPFCMATERNELIGLNMVGLRRGGVGRQALSELKRAAAALGTRIGDLREIAAVQLRGGGYFSAEARTFLNFFEGGKRGFVRERRQADSRVPLGPRTGS